jgi:amicyanin
MNSVEIKDYMYAPKAITVKVGTTVTWTNQDGVKHTVTTDNDAPAKIDSELFGKGETFSYTFEKAGTYNYYCQPHPYMKGSVTVTE